MRLRAPPLRQDIRRRVQSLGLEYCWVNIWSESNQWSQSYSSAGGFLQRNRADCDRTCIGWYASVYSSKRSGCLGGKASEKQSVTASSHRGGGRSADGSLGRRPALAFLLRSSP